MTQLENISKNIFYKNKTYVRMEYAYDVNVGMTMGRLCEDRCDIC